MICIVSSDAGGAEIISSWARRQKKNFLYVLKGPAVRIFQSKLGKIHVSELEVSIRKSEEVICGTSWESDIEKKAILYSKKIGKKVICFLDHWVNYQGRFVYKKRMVLPDEIWVVDKYAKNLAQRQFKGIKIEKKTNFYFKDLKLEIDKIKKKKTNNKHILFLSEPIAKGDFINSNGVEIFYDYSIRDAFNYFIENLSFISSEIQNVIIRPHPSETNQKWAWAQKNKLVKKINNKESLIEQILNSDLIVGCETMAMIVGVIAKKRVISIIPPGGKKCSLPHREIEHLQVIKKKIENI